MTYRVLFGQRLFDFCQLFSQRDRLRVRFMVFRQHLFFLYAQFKELRLHLGQTVIGCPSDQLLQ